MRSRPPISRSPKRDEPRLPRLVGRTGSRRFLKPQPPCWFSFPRFINAYTVMLNADTDAAPHHERAFEREDLAKEDSWSLGGNQPPATPQATQPQRGHAPPISHSPCTFLSLGCPHGQSGCNSLPFMPRGGAPGIILTGSRLLRTAPRAAQSPPKVPTSLSNSVLMSTEALGIIPNTPVHYRSERFEP